MRLIVLGSGAGGGIPQWNANNVISRHAFRGDPIVPQRTQASIAITADDVHWSIVNASPDLRTQVIATPLLHPKGRELRTSPIFAVALTGADIDQIVGLLTLRERQSFALFATQRVLNVLGENTVFDVLAEDVVARQGAADRRGRRDRTRSHRRGRRLAGQAAALPRRSLQRRPRR